MFVAFAPERIDPGVKAHAQQATPRVVGGVSEECFKHAARVLRHTCSAIHAVSSPEAAEMAKLMENTFRAANIALAFEFAEAARIYGLDAVEVIERVEREHGERLGLLCDLYHLAVAGDDLEATIDAVAERVAHVQVADAPGRGEPGSGSLDLDALLLRLQGAGYAGRVALEYQPTTSTADSLRWLPRDRRA